jgi:hypothetical protein
VNLGVQNGHFHYNETTLVSDCTMTLKFATNELARDKTGELQQVISLVVGATKNNGPALSRP